MKGNTKMALDYLESKIDGLRSEASSVRAAHSALRSSVQNNKSLSPQGMQEQIKESKARADARISELQAEELRLISEKLESSQRVLFGSAISSSDIIAERDAQDRADNIKTEAEALRLIERTVRSGDRSMTNAILRRALDAGWPNAIDEVGKSYPASAGVVRDISALNNTLNDIRHVLGRSMAYGSVID